MEEKEFEFIVTIVSEDTEYEVEVKAVDMFSAAFAAGCQVTNYPARFPCRQGWAGKFEVTRIRIR